MNNIKLIAILIFVASCSSESSQIKFESLLDSEWSKIVNDNPVYASSMGDLSQNTKWSDTSVENIYSDHQHELAVLNQLNELDISDFTEEDVKGATGRDKLAVALREAINTKLEALENFGGVEEVHFTSFVLQ